MHLLPYIPNQVKTKLKSLKSAVMSKNLPPTFLNDFLLAEARLSSMRHRKLINHCPKCMSNAESS